METERATEILECLSSPTRLRIYRLVVRQGAEGMVAGQIATQLDIPPNGASFHLKAMTHARLLSVKQEGRFQRYRADITQMFDLVAYLTEECCAGHPELCAPAAVVRVPVPGLKAPASRAPRAKR
ncbi:MAG TPA: helix-turn-helix domain-containing protein [Usitatibacteraceae bacterium]|nr:helix-turn-helix domain-containing protein [Usitatibacteraceae bacterium]